MVKSKAIKGHVENKVTSINVNDQMPLSALAKPPAIVGGMNGSVKTNDVPYWRRPPTK